MPCQDLPHKTLPPEMFPTIPALHAHWLVLQAEACRALSRGLTALPSADVARRGLAPALLTLDGAARLGTDAAHGDGQGGRLWPTGCAMLAAVLAFPLVRFFDCRLAAVCVRTT